MPAINKRCQQKLKKSTLAGPLLGLSDCLMPMPGLPSSVVLDRQFSTLAISLLTLQVYAFFQRFLSCIFSDPCYRQLNMLDCSDYKFAISPTSLGGQEIKWCDHVKYLGIYLARGRALKFDVNPLKRSFYAACNSILSHSDGISEIVLLNLQEAYSLSVLMCAHHYLC